MRIWTVHIQPGALAAPVGETPGLWNRRAPVVLLREGFSWAAFLFGALWLFWHRLWLAVLLYLLVALAIVMLLPAGAPFLSGGLALQFLLGAHGVDLRRRALARRGYRLDEVVAERDQDHAIARLLASRPDLATPCVRATLA